MCVFNNVKSVLTLQLGLLFLIIANIVSFVSRRVDRDIDFVMGAMFGISFGLIGLSIWRSRMAAER